MNDQFRQQSEIDTKASRLLRANLVLIGLLLSGFSFASRSNTIAAGPFLNPFSVAGITLLIASIVAAGMTYMATESLAGVSHETIRHLIRNEVDRAAAERALAKSYARWIEVNRRSNAINGFYISATVLLVLAAVVFLVTGAIVGALADLPYDDLRVILWVVAIAVVAGIGRLSGIRGDFDRWRANRTDGSPGVDQSLIRDDGE